MRSRGLILVEHRGARNVAVLSTHGVLWRCMWCAASGDGGDEEDAITFLEGAGFAAEEADVFFVEIDVEELADLALIVADVAAEIGEARGEFIEGFGDCGRATVHFGRAVGEAAEGGGDFDGHWHLSFSSVLNLFSVFSSQFSVKENPERLGKVSFPLLRARYREIAFPITLSRLWRWRRVVHRGRPRRLPGAGRWLRWLGIRRRWRRWS